MKKDAIYNDSWIFTLLLSTLLILAESVKVYTFQIPKISINISYSIILIPIIYLILNYIIKKYGSKKAISSMCLGAVAVILFLSIMSFSLNQQFSFKVISGELCAYLISSMLNILIYNYLLNNTTLPWPIIVINYLCSCAVFHMFYTLIYLESVTTLSFWKEYFITILIEFVIILVLSIIDKITRQGRDYK
jgi:uncharacterized PurR-regulated membrane protein YhhQ (DUF165 family)